jgi:transmembrane sensor
MNRTVLDKERLTAEAIDWLSRLNGQKVAHATRGHFIMWLLRSWQHVEAFLSASRVYGELGRVRSYRSRDDLARQSREDAPDSNVVPLRGPAQSRAGIDFGFDEKHRAPHRALKYAVAATIAAAFLAIGTLSYHRWDRAQIIHTDIGEQRSVMLDDGTAVYLNTGTSLSAKLSKADRRIVLTQGEARFTVAKDPGRPFLVSTPQAVVKALGTAFNVRVLEDRTVVTVIEGHVRVVNLRADGSEIASSVTVVEGQSKNSIELFANQQVSVDRNGRIIGEDGPPFDRAVGWTNRRIVFDDEPLSALVAEFNRYSEQPIVIADPKLAQHKIDGSFDTFDRSSLLDFLQRYQGVRVDEENGNLVLRRSVEPLPGR